MKTQCHRHDLKMSRNGNCDAKHHGNASAGTMVRLKLVFAARMCLQAVLDLLCMSSRLNIQKKTKRRLVTNEVRTRSERGTKRGQKLPGTDPYPNPGAGRFSASANSCSAANALGSRSANEKNKYRTNPNGDKMIP